MTDHQNKGHRRIGVFATPCGGTTYLCDRLKSLGLDVGHERMRSDGIVCGFWAHGDNRSQKMDRGKPHPDEYTFDALWTLVRHPLLVAETLPQFTERGRKHFSWTHEDPLLHALRYWVETISIGLVRSDYAVVRLDEHFEQDFAALCASIGALPWDVKDPKKVREPKRKNKRYEPMTWGEWYDRDPRYAARAQSLLRDVGMKKEVL